MLGVVLFALFLLLLVAWLWAVRQGQSSGLPIGTVVYQDTDRYRRPPAPLISERYALTGRPDYLMSSSDGAVIPVELKNAACPVTGPYENHVAQLFGYCLLVEDVLGKPVPYGILRYSDREVLLDFTPGRRQWVIGLLERIAAARNNGSASRNHSSPARCRNCSVRGSCSVALA